MLTALEDAGWSVDFRDYQMCAADDPFDMDVFLTKDLSATALVTLLTLGQAPAFVVWAAIDGGWFHDAGYLLPGLGCLLINLLANVAFVRALALSPLSLTIPFLSFTPVFASLLAIPLVGELPNAMQSGGIAAVVAGALLLHAGSGAGLLGLFGAFARERGSVLMVIVAALWSGTAVLDKVALGHASLAAHALVQTAGIGIALLLYLLARGRGAELGKVRESRLAMLGAIAFATLALALQLAAIQATLVAIVETVKRAVGMVMSVVLGRLVFAEPVTTAKVSAIVLMAAGTAAIVL